MHETAKNGILIRTESVFPTPTGLSGMLMIQSPGMPSRNILFSTEEVAEGIGRLMLKDFNGEKLSFVEEPEHTTVFTE